MTAIAAEAAVAVSQRSMACGPVRDKSLHQGTIQRVRCGAMDGWAGVMPSRKPQRVDPVSVTDHIVAAAQGFTSQGRPADLRNTFRLFLVSLTSTS
jgi:hypothetical protein